MKPRKIGRDLTGDDPAYFDVYSGTCVHEEMLKDESRTLTYMRALQHSGLLKGKVVLDVGCGTGILTMFALRAGAARVYAVDASEMAAKAARVIQDNRGQLGTGEVIFFQKRMEDVELPERVDIIVSEWMGYFLLYETMLPSVILARDRWLKPDGLMFPSSVKLYMVPIRWDEFLEDHVDYWEDVYGFNMESLKELAWVSHTRDPTVEDLDPSSHAGSSHCILEINCLTIPYAQVFETWTSEFSSKIYMGTDVVGFATWFDTYFPGGQVLSTGMDCKVTHWGQSVFFLPQPLGVQQDDIISGRISSGPNAAHPRSVDVEIDWVYSPGQHSKDEVSTKAKTMYHIK